MFLSNFSVKRPVTIVMTILIILILGFVSLTRLSTDLFPSVNLPFAAVSVSYFGAAPSEIETLVTKNIENAVSTVSNIKSVSSVSSESNSLVLIEFTASADMDTAVLEMRERINLIKPLLPEGATEPLVIKFNPNMMPIMGIAATKNDQSLSELTDFINQNIVPRLERLEGVGQVSVAGGSRNEIVIRTDKVTLDEYGVTTDMISGLLKAQNMDLPVGISTEDGKDYIVRIMGTIGNIEDIKALPLASAAKGLFTLGDVAKVELDEVQSGNYSRVNGENSLTLTMQRQSEYNTTEVAGRVNAELEKIKSDFPDIEFTSVFDQSEYINSMVKNVSLNGLIGAVLAVLILLLFLKDLRPTFVIGIAIPISVVAAFILIYFTGITINVISLGGLALGIGMLVDNSIVVLENIFRFRKEGKSAVASALEGASQVSGAIIASTLTTVCVFLPVVFVEGITAQLFREMALTVSFSLIASLFIALTLVPMMSSKLFHSERDIKVNRTYERVKNAYTSALSFSLNHRIAVIICSLIIFGASIGGIFLVGAQFFPESDQGQINISVVMPKGTNFRQTTEVVSQAEERLFAVDEILTVSARVSSGASGIMMFAGGSSDTGTVDVVLVPRSQRKLSTPEVAKKIRLLLEDLPGEIQVSEQTSNFMMFGSSSPIAVEIKGQDLAMLETVSADIRTLLQEIGGVINIESSLDKGSPELRITADPSRTTPLGLTSLQIASVVREAVSGISGSALLIDGKQLDVRFRLSEETDVTPEDIKEMMIMSPVLGSEVPLSMLASIETASGYSRIERSDGSRVVTVSAGLDGTLTVREAASKLEDRLKDYDIPDGYFITVAGENEQILDAFSDLYLALVLAVILVYMVMAAQFESFLHPFIIMFSIPLAFSGALIALIVTGTPLSVPALIGVIVLAGIVVNNGIVLIDYINRLRSTGLSRNEAIMEAGPVRLRPILMTALTTILALFPLALGIGEGAELEAPLAIAAVGGLVFSTLLTLILIPVLYSLFGGKSRKKTAAEA